MPTATFALRDIDPNPFRNLKGYPLNPKKIDALRASIGATDFWDNILARPHPTKPGRAQVAYGHHRLEALRREFGPNHKITLTIRSLDNARMIKVMANENMEEWGSDARADIETVRTVVKAFAAGEIKLREPAAKASDADCRVAPSFTLGVQDKNEHRSRLYNGATIADFLGWTQPSGRAPTRLEVALSVLELNEQGFLRATQFDNLTTKQAETLVTLTRRARNRREAGPDALDWRAQNAAKEGNKKERARLARAAAAIRAKHKPIIVKVGEAVAEHFHKGGSVRDAPAVARRRDPKRTPPPDLPIFQKRLAKQVANIFERENLAAKLDDLVKFRSHLDDDARKDTAQTLREVGQRFIDFADRMLEREMKPVRVA